MPITIPQINIPTSTSYTISQTALMHEIAVKNYDFSNNSIRQFDQSTVWQHALLQSYTYSSTEKVNEKLGQLSILSPYYLIEKIKEIVVLQKGVPEYVLNTDIIPNLLLTILNEINTFVPLFGNSVIYFYKDYEDTNYRQLVLKISTPGLDREGRNTNLHKACDVLSKIIAEFKQASLPEQISIIDDFYYLFSIKFIS